MITCDTTITNTITGIDPISGVASGSAVISVTECTGPANGRLDPMVLVCASDEQILVNLVTHVDQCNGVGYGGGNVLECSVDVINNFLGVTPASDQRARPSINATAPRLIRPVATRFLRPPPTQPSPSATTPATAAARKTSTATASG